MNYPKRTFTAADADMTLAAAGLTGRREALFLHATSADTPEAQAMDVEPLPGQAADPESVLPAAVSRSQADGIWASAAQAHVSMLDRKLSEERRQGTAEAGADASVQAQEQAALAGQELVDLFQLLVAAGVDRHAAAAGAQQYGRQLRELVDMGFADVRQDLEYLNRYSGRMLRVVNALSERPAEGLDAREAEAPSEGAGAPAGAAAGVAAPLPPQKDMFQRTFAELVASGLDPNEAAARAVLAVQGAQPASGVSPLPQSQSARTADPGPQTSAPTAGPWAEELAELSAMGFTDTAKNLELLERYQGRLVRVVNVLAGGD